MLSRIKIEEASGIPKYIQITESIIHLIEDGKVKLGDKLPSINEAFKKWNISRDTVISAYNELKSRGVIAPQHGKGFYISDVYTPRKLKIFVLFDVMNGYKAILYRSLVKHLGENCTLDIYFHHYNKHLFENLITTSLGSYSYYIIMPHFNEDVSEIVSKIPGDKLLLIDKEIESLDSNCTSVFQDFEKDIYESLRTGLSLLKKYKRLFMVMNREFQFIPDGLVSGFLKFTKEFKIECGFVDQLAQHDIHKGDAFLVFSDSDLVNLIKISRKKSLDLGKSIGVISYDDTPLKEVLADGITVISTDFKKMGETAAHLILNRNRSRVANPCRLIKRKSL